MVNNWRRLHSELQGDFTIFRVRRDRSESPETGLAHDFYVLEANDWVNIVPVTADGKVVCVEQYRHGTGEVTLEVPGGIVDDEDPSPMAAARREMVEETGYDSKEIALMGKVAPNPAIQNNWTHCFVAVDAKRVQGQDLEAAEDIRVRLLDPSDLPAMVSSGHISHALVVVAFYYFHLYRQEHPGLF